MSYRRQYLIFNKINDLAPPFRNPILFFLYQEKMTRCSNEGFHHMKSHERFVKRGYPQRGKEAQA
jgi:hypothetical protein